jgi:hypothetical protein
LNPPSPPVLTHLNAISTLSPIHECRQSLGLTRLITGGSLLAFIGILKEFSSVTIVRKSSKSAKLGAQKATESTTLIPGAISPIALLGNFIFFNVKFSLYKGYILKKFTFMEELILFYGKLMKHLLSLRVSHTDH